MTNNEPGFQTTPNTNILVTGSSGFVGSRLVEMLFERGASTIICLDITPPSDSIRQRFDAAASSSSSKKQQQQKWIDRSGPTNGDITNPETLESSFRLLLDEKIDIVYHTAALVGPYFQRAQYLKVNYEGTLNMLNLCQKYQVTKFIYSSSPSTRFTGADVEGPREEDLPIPDKFVALYAETKALAERKVTEACNAPHFMTVAIAPHQVYGPWDSLFLPSLLETMGCGRLRVFGKGRNRISFCYVDNYCHGLMCGADSLKDEEESVSLGKFYIVTDGKEQLFWDRVNEAGMAMGFKDLFSKFHLPLWLLWIVAYISLAVEKLTGKKSKLNPFSLRMLIIHRYFSIENARRDLKYEPLVEFDDAWKSTIEWFKIHWLPGYLDRKNNKGASTAGGHAGVFEKKKV